MNSNYTSRTLIANCLSSLDDCGSAELRIVQHLSRNVRHWKQQTLRTPPLPSEITGFVIPPELQNLDSRERFLQYDSGSNDENRVLLLSQMMAFGIYENVKIGQWMARPRCHLMCFISYLQFMCRLKIQASHVLLHFFLTNVK